MKQIENSTQAQYHQARFNPKMLPDLANAGPVSASILHDARVPMKFLMAKEKATTTDMEWGSMVDVLWLTPNEWEQHFATLPDKRPRKPTIAQRAAYEKGTAKPKTVEGIDWWDAWEKKTIGKTTVDKVLLEEVRVARSMLELHPIAQFIWMKSEKQVILVGELPGNCLVSGAKAKCMMDLLPMEGEITIEGQTVNLSECVVDLKQCHDCSEYGMRNAMRRFEYHMKMAWYRRCINAWQPGRVHGVLIFQHSNPPYDVHVRLIDPEDMRLGDSLVQQRLDAMCGYDHRDMRPLFDTEVTTLSLTNWMREES